LNTSVANEPFPLIVSEAQRKRTRHWQLSCLR
jgi:hypothetical protein